MATSASTNYSITAREVIEYALRKVNILAKSETADADTAAAAMMELNVLLKGWQKYPSLWRLTEASVAPTAATASISLTAANPYRVLDCRYRNTSSIDLPLRELTRQEYYDLPSKTTAGTPTAWYFDPQLATNTLYLWPVLATVTTETIKFTHQRRIEDIDDLSNDLDITQEHFETVGYNLAARIADDYGRKGEHISRIIARAESLKGEMMDADRPEVIRFVPERRYG